LTFSSPEQKIHPVSPVSIESRSVHDLSDSGSQTPRGELGARLRLIREEIYGPEGAADLAAALGIPALAWTKYEAMGELAPAQVLLKFIELTGVDPLWLLSGEGPRYRAGRGPGSGEHGRGKANSSPVPHTD
jgi:hypothetical protein